MADNPTRILWNTFPWFSLPDANFSAWSQTVTPNPLAGHNRAGAMNGLELASDHIAPILRNPRLGLTFLWNGAGEEADPLPGSSFDSDDYFSDGRIPANQTYYTVRFQFPQAIPINCLYVTGVENAELHVFGSDDGTTWTEFTLADPWDNELRQDEHWTGVLSQKFMVFDSTQTYEYYRVDFVKASNLNMYGLIGRILAGVYYEVEAENSDNGIDFVGDGAATGGVYTQQSTERPVFRSVRFRYDFATKADVKQFSRMFFNRIKSFPIVVQFYQFDDQDFHCVYGVADSGAGTRPEVIDLQTLTSFRVNEISIGRAGEAGFQKYLIQ